MSRSADQLLAARPDLLERDFTWRPVVRLISAVGAVLGVYFRVRTAGIERIPPGGCLVVANHSSGAIFETILLLRWWRRHLGDRPVHGLAHRVAFEPPLGLLPLAPWIGAVLAHPEVARRVLARGEALLVFPGGDLDACRSFGERDRVIFGGRAGFVRTAREANVPIVPLAITGSHACYVLLPGARRVASVLRLGRRGFKAFFCSVGMLLFFAAAVAALVHRPLWPLALAAFVQMFVPAPTRIELEVLEPIRPAEGEPDEAVAERVRRAMEEAIARRAAARLTPWG